MNNIRCVKSSKPRKRVYEILSIYLECLLRAQNAHLYYFGELIFVCKEFNFGNSVHAFVYVYSLFVYWSLYYKTQNFERIT